MSDVGTTSWADRLRDALASGVSSADGELVVVPASVVRDILAWADAQKSQPHDVTESPEAARRVR